MKLYFTRHGQTVWNKERRFQGMFGDSALLPSSLQEVQQLGTYLANVPFEKIYCSSAKRARKTAKIIAKELKKSVNIVYTDDLLEIGLGMIEGKSIDKMKQKYPEQLNNLRYHLDCYDAREFGGEAIIEVIDRIEKVVVDAVLQAQTGPLLFVGHGAALTAAIQAMTGRSLAQLRQMGGLANNSLTIVKTKEQLPYELVKWNETDFLL